MKKSLAALSVLSAFVAAPAFAEDGPSANVSMTTNYKFRGQDQTGNKPAIQGGFDYALGNFYVGVWNSSINFANGIETDVYGGYKGDLGRGIGYDVGVMQYLYPGDSEAKTTELYGGVSYGIFSAKYSHTVSKDYFNLSGPADKGRGTGYLFLAANFDVAPKLTGNVSVGRTNLKSYINSTENIPDFVDYRVGMTYDLGKGFALGGHVTGATKKNNEAFIVDDKQINKTRFILSVSKAM